MNLINKHETPIKTVDLTDMTVLNLSKTKQTEQRKLTGRCELIAFQTKIKETNFIYGLK